MIKRVIKRDGRIVPFDNQKIVAAILKAMDVTEAGEDIVLAATIADSISKKNKEEMGELVQAPLECSPRLVCCPQVVPTYGY